MTRDHMLIISCDGDDGSCGRIETDWFESLVLSIDGVRITSTQRAPGWTSVDDEDFCPQHKPVTPAPTTSPETPDEHAHSHAQR